MRGLIDISAVEALIF